MAKPLILDPNRTAEDVRTIRTIVERAGWTIDPKERLKILEPLLFDFMEIAARATRHDRYGEPGDPGHVLLDEDIQRRAVLKMIEVLPDFLTVKYKGRVQLRTAHWGIPHLANFLAKRAHFVFRTEARKQRRERKLVRLPVSPEGLELDIADPTEGSPEEIVAAELIREQEKEDVENRIANLNRNEKWFVYVIMLEDDPPTDLYTKLQTYTGRTPAQSRKLAARLNEKMDGKLFPYLSDYISPSAFASLAKKERAPKTKAPKARIPAGRGGVRRVPRRKRED